MLQYFPVHTPRLEPSRAQADKRQVSTTCRHHRTPSRPNAGTPANVPAVYVAFVFTLLWSFPPLPLCSYGPGAHSFVPSEIWEIIFSHLKGRDFWPERDKDNMPH